MTDEIDLWSGTDDPEISQFGHGGVEPVVRWKSHQEERIGGGIEGGDARKIAAERGRLKWRNEPRYHPGSN